ncbi:MAG TPA: hypothetical protein V6C90_14615 [Coleofasciculaceae cyanobacterium]
MSSPVVVEPAVIGLRRMHPAQLWHPPPLNRYALLSGIGASQAVQHLGGDERTLASSCRQ